jgi:Trehalase-like, N-terminal
MSDPGALSSEAVQHPAIAALPARQPRAPSEYLPIADHGVIGDLRTVALIGTDGTIDWYCPPRFDSPSVFGAILDSGRGGHYRIAPVGECATKQLYFPDTNVLVTRFLISRRSTSRPATTTASRTATSLPPTRGSTLPSTTLGPRNGRASSRRSAP